MKKAWLNLAFSLSIWVLGLLITIFSIEYFIYGLVFGVIVSGLGLTSIFILLHEAAHGAFADKKTNNIVGHFLSLITFYPYNGWMISHNKHHSYVDNLEKDPNWPVYTTNKFEESNIIVKTWVRMTRGLLFPLESVRYMLKNSLIFGGENVKERELKSIWFSNILVLAFLSLSLPVIYYFFGIIGLFSLWFLPLVIMHTLIALTTLLHHTSPEIKVFNSDNWSKEESNLLGTVHVNYPRWLEIIIHDFNIHIPHHVSTAVPSYNLRNAYQSLKVKYGDIMPEHDLTLNHIVKVLDNCKLYDMDEDRFVKFR
jgi:omega-6 fatty acid desaturase (delta-12 desaturase)